MTRTCGKPLAHHRQRAVRGSVVHDDDLVRGDGRRLRQRPQRVGEVLAGVERHDDDREPRHARAASSSAASVRRRRDRPVVSRQHGRCGSRARLVAQLRPRRAPTAGRRRPASRPAMRRESRHRRRLRVRPACRGRRARHPTPAPRSASGRSLRTRRETRTRKRADTGASGRRRGASRGRRRGPRCRPRWPERRGPAADAYGCCRPVRAAGRRGPWR